MSSRTRTARAAVALLCLLTSACTTSGRAVTQGTSVAVATQPPDDLPSTDRTSPASSPANTDTVDVDPGVDNTHNTDHRTPLEWGPCEDPEASDEVLECAVLPVPLDHLNPTGEPIELALVRVPAADDNRVGAILFNPGGPGASGFDYVAQAGPTIVAEMGLERFDLIGFDPRGVERSNGLRCLTDAERDATEYLDETPETPEEDAALEAAEDDFVRACLEKYGDTLRHYSTEQTARDMDALRVALGDDRISLLMISYGTYLAAVYATLFPEHVRAMVLDSPYEPSGDTVEEEYTTQLVGFERAFDNWARWCETADECALRSDDVGATWDQLSERLDEAPVEAQDGRAANQTVMQVATISALYSESSWPVLAAALAEVRDGDPSALFAMADEYIGRSPDGTYSTIHQSGPIIRCASGIDPAVPDDPAALVETLHRLAPRFGKNISVEDFEDSCAQLMPEPGQPELHYEGDAAIVVVGGTNDPATPFRWAEEMAAAMGDAALVTFTGEGHGFLLASRCVTEIEASTLADLELPDEGTVCEPDPVIERPSWWDDLPVPDEAGEVFVEPAVLGQLGFGPTVAYTELRTSTASPAEVLDAYDDALEDEGFAVGDRQEPVPGVHQGVYLHPDEELFSVVVFGHEGFDEPDLATLGELVPPGRTLIVLLALPG